MLISEFIERTGFTPTEDYYHTVIEPEYNRSQLDKDVWCKQWKRKGGIQAAYDYMVNEAANEACKAKSLSHNVDIKVEEIADLRQKFETVKEMLADAKSQLDDERNTREKLTVFMVEQAQKWSATDLRDMAITLMGPKRYLAYKLEHEIPLWAIDTELLVSFLK